jgi:Tfp pilus assembly protein PilN
MIRINLLAPDSIKKEERNDILALGYLFIILLTIAAGANYVVKLRSYQMVQTRLSDIQKELGRYESIVRQVDALQATKKILEMKKNVINALLSSGLIYPRFMEDLLQLLPSGVSFKTLTTRLATDCKMTVTLTAEAVDNYSIADFMSALGGNADFTNVELGPVMTIGGAKSPSSNFNLTFCYQKKKS